MFDLGIRGELRSRHTATTVPHAVSSKRMRVRTRTSEDRRRYWFLPERAGRARRTELMKNVWKGLVVGAFTGAGIGWVLDLLDGGAKKIVAAEGRVGEAVQQNAPQLAARVRQGVSETVSRVQDADLPGQLKEAADATGRKVAAPEKLKEAAGATRQKVARAAERGSTAIGSLTT
ncbi:MAG TPA: hypothetical protein VHU17_02080 [Acidimicrobiales bacterium]|nr:hypothetical protein [Acidimicrobiales bacterium]